MPYLRRTDPDPMPKLMRGYGLNGVEIAAILNVSSNTGSKRLQNPGSLTLDELRRLSSHGHIPIDEIRSAI